MFVLIKRQNTDCSHSYEHSYQCSHPFLAEPLCFSTSQDRTRTQNRFSKLVWREKNKRTFRFNCVSHGKASPPALILLLECPAIFSCSNATTRLKRRRAATRSLSDNRSESGDAYLGPSLWKMSTLHRKNTALWTLLQVLVAKQEKHHVSF